MWNFIRFGGCSAVTVLQPHYIVFKKVVSNLDFYDFGEVVSMIGYALLTVLVGDYNQALFNVLLIDLLGIAFLSLAAVLTFLHGRP